MCHPLIFIVLLVLTLQSVTSYPCKDYILAYIPIEELAYLLPENNEAMPVPYYNNAFFYDPWNFQGRIMQSARFPYRQTRGPVSFGGQVGAKGGVTITGSFGNHGFGTFTSHSPPPTPLIVTPQPEYPTTSNLLIDTISPISTRLPTITTLPAVTLPSPTINQPFTDIVPSAVSVPTMPLPFIVVTTTVPYNREYTSAQAIPYGVSNRAINNARGTPNGLAMGRGLANGIGRNMPIAGNNMARGNIINRQNLANPYYANNNLVNNLVYGHQKMPNPTLANIVETNLANPIISANQVLANDITAATLENLASANIMPNVATPVVANVPQGTTYNFGNSPIPVTVTGSSHGNHHVGINILADNLEVKGLVTVVGRMPIFGAVTLNGNVPSDGMASVNYSCGSPAAV